MENEQEMIAALEALVVDNDDLLELESLIGRFNIFDALDVARREVRHSNFLAFLLTPAESHGLGQLFLRALLMDVLKATPPHLRPLSPIELDGADLHGVDVRREWRHIDILIRCEHPCFAVAIENKVDSSEHSNQLARYEAEIDHAYPGIPKLCVLLSPSGLEPSSARWVPYTYENLYRVLDRTRRASRNAIGIEVGTFLEHYLSLIGTRFMTNPAVDDLCRRIYVNHRRALDLIYERAGEPGLGVAADVETVLRADPRVEVFYRARHVVDFVPKEWLVWLKNLGLDRPEAPKSWLILRLEVNGRRLDFYAEVRRMEDLDRRRRIVQRLIDEGERFGFHRRNKALTVTNSYTRVSGREGVLEWGENEEPDVVSIRTAVKKKLDSVLPKLAGVESAIAELQ